MRLTTALLLCLLLLPLVGGAQKIYKHVDEDGNVTYSDSRISEDDEEAQLPELSVVPGRPAEAATGGTAADPATELPTYSEFAITSPEHEQTVFYAEGPVQVTLSVQPELFPGDRFQVFMDGELVSESREPTSTIDPVYRGEHVLTARIVDLNGRTVVSSAPVTFFRRQPTVNRPG